jgi:hypothetical protein
MTDMREWLWRLGARLLSVLAGLGLLFVVARLVLPAVARDVGAVLMTPGGLVIALLAWRWLGGRWGLGTKRKS